MNWLRAMIVTLLAGSMIILVSSTATAMPGGIEISPAIEELTSSSGQSSISFPISVTNHSRKPVVIYVNTSDFTTLGDNGEVSFYGQGYNPSSNPHGLAQWLKLNLNQFSLSLNQSKVVTVSIDNLGSLAAGGHYGAVTFYVGNSPSLKSAKAEVSNNQVLSALVFLTSAGGGTETLALKQAVGSSWYLNTPQSMQLVLADEGNTQTTPRGYVMVENAAGTRELARGILNPGSSLELPSSARLFSVNLIKERGSLFGGDYKFVIAYRPDNASHFSYYQKSFYLIGFFWIWLIIALVLLAVAYVWLHPRLERWHFAAKIRAGRRKLSGR